jgi:hypothetical protein
MEKEKVRSVFLGHVVEKVSEFKDGHDWTSDGYFTKPYISNYNKGLNYETIEECDLEKPPLKQREEIYLSKLGKHVIIEQITRGTDNSITYTTDYIVKTINKEKSEKQKIEVEKQLKDELVKYNKWDNETREEREELRKKAKIEADKPSYKYSQSELAKMLGFITPEQKSIIDDLQELNK